MRFGTFCSGIGAPEVAFAPLGWQSAFVSEIEPFPCSLLKHRFHEVPNLGDMTKISPEMLDAVGPVDLVCAGTPCQSFSVAGLRKGMADPRGNLALTFLGLVDHLRPTWVVWENVPGVLSSNGGRDFGSFLGAILELGYGFAYRVLDAANFGLAARERVFVVGYLGDWRRAAAVLFDEESLRWNPPASRERSTYPCLCASMDAKWGSNQWVRSGFGILDAGGIRRPTARECERLLGFPDDWTLVPHRGKPAPDGPRCKAIGNSMAVPVVRWIAERIQAVEAI